MASNGVSVLLFISTILCLFSLSSQQAQPQPKPFKRGLKPKVPPGGTWQLFHPNIGVSAMHMQLMHNNKIVIFDRTDTGPSNLTLDAGNCRKKKDARGIDVEDCHAYSVMMDLKTKKIRPLKVHTDVWCSSGAVSPDGTLVQTGGFQAGADKIRLFKTCYNDNDPCDWQELPEGMGERRWYSTDQILPDGRIIIIGGEMAFSYEFFPKEANKPLFYRLPFLEETKDFPQPDNLYPAVHLLPDGNLFVFANRRSILLDYINHRVIKEYPMIPGEIRSYPCTGTSAMLPIKLNKDQQIPPEAEVMICGGTKKEAPLLAESQKIFIEASRTCGRLKVTDPNPQWFMEEMPMPRMMPDMVNLPTGDILIVNGGRSGSGGWEWGEDAVLEPVLYRPYEQDLKKRFKVQNPSKIPRMYHSTALLLPDARVLISGSNPHQVNTFTGKFPTDLTMETFTPDYLTRKGHYRPSIKRVSAQKNVIKYGERFEIEMTVRSYRSNNFQVVLAYPSFTTHSVQMNQRLVVLPVEEVKPTGPPGAYKVSVQGPLSGNVAPPGYYMLFVVNGGIPGHSVWVQIVPL